MGIEMFSLEGKTAFVTGASRGIGAAMAIAFAEAGADVAVAARTTDALEDIAGKIEALGRKALAVTCDVTDPDQVDAAVQTTIDGLGGIDIAVNNAGGNDRIANVVDADTDEWHRKVDLNLNSVFYCARAEGRHMLERGSGSVINVASIAGLGSTPMIAVYGATKAGVINLSQTLAMEWGARNVRCNALCPGWIRTDLNKLLWQSPELGPAMIKDQAIERWGETEDLMGAAIWLASDASRYTTGSAVVVDGGLTSSRGFSLELG